MTAMFIAPRACNLIEITTGGRLSYGVVISLDEYIPVPTKSAAKLVSRGNSFDGYYKYSFSCLESANSTFRWLGFAEYASSLERKGVTYCLAHGKADCIYKQENS